MFNTVKNGVWQPKHNATETHMRSFGDTMHELRKFVLSMTENPTDRDFRIEARRASVALRKLLLDDKALLRNVMQTPMFHKLVKPMDTEPAILNMNGPISYRASLDSPPLWTTRIKGKIEIHSLPGWTHRVFSQWELTSDIFDISIPPELTRGKWLTQPLLKIETEKDKKVFSLQDVLRYVANTEGAHADDYEPPRGKLKGKARDAQFLEMLGGQDTLTYPHWVAVCVATYLYNRHHAGLVLQREEWQPHVEKNVVTSLDEYALRTGGFPVAPPLPLPERGFPIAERVHITGKIPNLSWTGPFMPLGVNINTPESPPPKHQEYRWVITSAVK